MKIIVLNGSPKGDTSVTLQYVRYIQKKFSHHEYKIFNIAQQIGSIEKDEKVFESIIAEIASSDGVIWVFPLYIFAVASQYKRFIELIFERNAQSAFKGKYAAVIATSVKLYDHTAINYVNAISDDLGMNFVDSFSPKMEELTNPAVRENLVKFAQNYFDAIDKKEITLKNFSPVIEHQIAYQPQMEFEKLSTGGKRVVIITDTLKNENQEQMIEAFRSYFKEAIELVNMEELDIKGGCLGCLRCGYNYECAYTGKDGFIDFFKEKVMKADILVLAGSVKDRYLSSAWKRFFDRAFFNTHTPVLMGKQVGFIVSGPLKQNPNLTQMMDIYFQYQYANLVGFATDEYDTGSQIDEQLYALAGRLVKLAGEEYTKPKTYLGVGGWKILRDEVWGELRFPFVADYRAYKKMGVFKDFPQKDLKGRFGHIVMLGLTKFKKVRNEIYHNQLKPNMMASQKKVADDPNL